MTVPLVPLTLATFKFYIVHEDDLMKRHRGKASMLNKQGRYRRPIRSWFVCET